MTKKLSNLQERYRQFLIDRDLKKYNTPQNVAQAISVEAAELVELFLWQDNISSERVKNDSELMKDIQEELADIIIYCMAMSIELDLDLEDIVDKKLDQNEDRFDQERVEKIRKDLEGWQK